MDFSTTTYSGDTISRTLDEKEKVEQMEPKQALKKRPRRISSSEIVDDESSQSKDPPVSVTQKDDIIHIDISKKHSSDLADAASNRSLPILNTLIAPDSIAESGSSNAAGPDPTVSIRNDKDHSDLNGSKRSAAPNMKNKPSSKEDGELMTPPVLRPNATRCSKGPRFPPRKKASRSDASDSTLQNNRPPTGFDSPSSMRMNLKYVLLEELLMANEEWNAMPKQAKPLNGTCNAEFSNTDYYNMLYHLITRAVKQHSILQRFKTMPILDQVALMKNQARVVMIVRNGIMHHWRERKMVIEYPGCPQVCDDVQRHLPSNSYLQAMRLITLYPDCLRPDLSVTVILSAVTLFDIDRTAGLVEGGAAKETKELYLVLLKDYLENRYGEAAASVTYQTLTCWINCMSIVAANMPSKSEFELDPLTFDVQRLSVPYLN